MKKLLFQLDTDVHPAVFDNVVAYDGGADHVIGYGDVTPENVTPLVEGTIFTRALRKNNSQLYLWVAVIWLQVRNSLRRFKKTSLLIFAFQ